MEFLHTSNESHIEKASEIIAFGLLEDDNTIGDSYFDVVTSCVKDDLFQNDEIIVCVDCDEMDGVAAIKTDKVKLTGELSFLVIDECKKNKRIGSKLLNYVENYLFESGMEKVVLSSKNNSSEFYKKNGYDFISNNEIRMSKKL